MLLVVNPWYWLLISVGVALAVYFAFIAALIVIGEEGLCPHGRSVRARLLIVLFRRLMGDPRIPRRKKIVLAALVPYLAMPFDIVPDFIPVAGYLDDAVIVALVLRYVLRGSDPLIRGSTGRARRNRSDSSCGWRATSRLSSLRRGLPDFGA